LGRANVTTEASLLASCLALPREGHLKELYHVFAYLRDKHNVIMVFDPSEPDINEASFQKKDWSASIYQDTKEILLGNQPEARGFGFKIRAYIDSDHAGNSVTRRSRIGFLVFLNSAPIY